MNTITYKAGEHAKRKTIPKIAIGASAYSFMIYLDDLSITDKIEGLKD